MTDKTSEPMADYVEQMAWLLDLPLDPASRPSIIQNMETMRAIARLVTEFPLPEEIEVAPVFEP